MVNRRIFVVGFGLYGSIHGPSEYSVNIQVKDCTRFIILGYQASDLTILESFEYIARCFVFHNCIARFLLLAPITDNPH